ncbi:type II toxin-antitoxin system RelB/DinJ family antitoxin [Lacticaseibacillus kribbianus]|uniref:type II toxin-antitoxin system RelB/DinJ family antitoxin n=1 Tax=Lacticaseibacillus kribbianus TaxID=2926292 RepID=UPI001CD455A7|nr:type II toxin-antitoxin system RelB/DinJ family antitoxin [Lacticaseibacillus kribbianus]
MQTKRQEARLNIRLDAELKQEATDIANDMGIDLTTVIKMTLTQMVKDHRLPFTPTSLPIETIQALKELDHAENYPTYATVDEMKKAIDA